LSTIYFNKVKKSVIIVAGGKGNRFKSEIPKQFMELEGKPILMHTIEVFYNFSREIEILVVLPEDQMEYWKSLCAHHQFNIYHKLIEGGAERYFSVKNGLEQISAEGLVAIHDGVRPMIDKTTIENCFKMAEIEGNAVPVIDLTDSVREIQKDGTSLHVDRNRYKLIQTPQVFRSSLIIEAYKKGFSQGFTDDASVLEALIPGCIKLVQGNRQNIKITTSEDFKYAEAILKSR
jgi:2-C-methyl-D-erythritol 4-phosphate cytidylyltransferase